MLRRTFPVTVVLASLVASGARANGFCFGDSGCPCGNDAPAGTRGGCLNSFSMPGVLSSSGVSAISADTVVLTASGLPSNAFAQFVVGDQPFLQGTPFHDGLHCVNAITRFGSGNAVAGAIQYPNDAGDPGVHTFSSAPNQSRYYQAVYRNAVPTFCTPGTLNTTNGFEIVWLP